MTAYELMIRTNHRMICDGDVPENEKSHIARRLLAARSSPVRIKRFYDDVRCSGKSDNENSSRMYPKFYIPPMSSGRKLRTITGQLPKTQLFSSNMYELEILEALRSFCPERRGQGYGYTDARPPAGITILRGRVC